MVQWDEERQSLVVRYLKTGVFLPNLQIQLDFCYQHDVVFTNGNI